MRSPYSTRTDDEKEAERDQWLEYRDRHFPKRAIVPRSPLHSPTRRQRNAERRALGMTGKAYRKHTKRQRREDA